MADGTYGGSNDAALPLIATDDAGAAGQVQIVKLALSADGSADPITADASGLLVNLGTNNDVTVASLPLPSGAATAALQTQPGVDIGDVTVNNGAGAAAVNVQDGGNALTVDGTVTAAQATAANLNATVVGTGTFAVQDAAAEASLSVLDDWDESDRAKVNPIVGQAGIAAGTGVDGVTVPRVSLATNVALPAGTNNIGDVDVLTLPNVVVGSGTLTAVTAITNAVTVNSHAVTNAGVFATQVDGAALTALQLIDDPVFADEAAFTIASSKVMMAGAHSVLTGAAPDSAAVDAAVSPVATRTRVPFVIGGDPGVITLKHTTITTAVTDAAIVTVTTPNKIVVTRISVTLDNASTVFPTLLIGFGAANTPTTTGVLVAHGGVPAGGGITVGDGSGILGVGADAEDLRVTTTGNATGNGLQIVVTYYLVPS